MGGNALKNCTTRRFERVEYFKVSDAAFWKINRHFHPAQLHIIEAYRLKESYGDCDILLENDNLPSNWVQILLEEFKPKDYVKNGNVLSLEFREMQVDIISTPFSEFKSSKQYFAYNDLGNLIGRVAHSMGLKLGHDGLTYKFYGDNERHLFKELKLLDDWEDILPVLGYNWDRYQQGFDTLEDIFKFVVSSPFFNKSIYALENRNHAARTRDQKRKTYMEFLKWLESYEETNTQNAQKYMDRLDYIGNKIPSFWEQYYATVKEYEQAKEYKKRFNGELVSEWTGLKEKELGSFMKWLKNERDEVRWKKDVVTLNPELVQTLVCYYFEKYKKALEV